MKSTLFRLAANLVFSWALVAGPQTSAAAGDGSGAFYVATNGNDGWSGGLRSPTRSRKDGPFATVQRALAASREWRKGTANSGQVSILVAPGFYPQPEP